MASFLKGAANLTLWLSLLIVAIITAYFLIVEFSPSAPFNLTMPSTNSISLCLSEYNSYKLCSRMEEMFTKRQWPPLWFFLASSIAALLSSAAFIYTVMYNRSKDKNDERDRLSNIENDVYDKFWFRKVMYDKSIRPMLDYVVELTKLQEQTASAISVDSVEKLLKYIAENHSDTRKQLLSLKDFHGYQSTHKALVKKLEQLRDQYVSVTSGYLTAASERSLKDLPQSDQNHKNLAELLNSTGIHEVYSELVNTVARTHHELATRK